MPCAVLISSHAVRTLHDPSRVSQRYQPFNYSIVQYKKLRKHLTAFFWCWYFLADYCYTFSHAHIRRIVYCEYVSLAVCARVYTFLFASPFHFLLSFPILSRPLSLLFSLFSHTRIISKSNYLAVIKRLLQIQFKKIHDCCAAFVHDQMCL